MSFKFVGVDEAVCFELAQRPWEWRRGLALIKWRSADV